MAQHDQNIADGSGAVVRGDINDALAALWSLNSGATAPTVTVAYMWWADTGNGLLKQRNAANTAWIDHGSLASALLRESSAGVFPGGLVQLNGSGNLPVAPYGHIRGINLSNSVIDPTNDIVFDDGEAASDGPVPILMAHASGISQLDVVYGTGNGGRFDTSISDGTWHCFVISDGTTVSRGFSKSLDPTGAANYPSGYGHYRRVGSIIRQSGAIRAFLHDGDNFWWASPALDVSVANPGGSPVSRTLTVPLGLQVIAKLNVIIRSDSASAAVYLSDLDLAATSPTQTGVCSIVADSAATLAGAPVQVRTSVTGEIRSEFDNSGSQTLLRIGTAGWVDTRGRL